MTLARHHENLMQSPTYYVPGCKVFTRTLDALLQLPYSPHFRYAPERKYLKKNCLNMKSLLTLVSDGKCDLNKREIKALCFFIHSRLHH